MTVASSSQASLLIYEGFNGYDTSANSLILQSPNSHTLGLSNNLYALGSATTGVAYTPTAQGMTFGALQTSGGALAISSTSTNVASTKLASDFPTWTSGNTLYSSFILNLYSASTSGSSGFAIRITSQDGTPGNLNTDAKFNAFAVSRTETGHEGLAVSYDNTWNQSSSASGNVLATSQPYLILSRYSQVGTALSPQTPGKAEIWALDLAQFENFVASGRQEDWLSVAGNYSAYSSETLTAGTFNFGASDHLQFVSIGQIGTLDEVRFGTSLWDVTPLNVPEPHAWSLLMTGALVMGLKRSRHRSTSSHRN